MFPKPKRKVDKSLLQEIREKPCLISDKNCMGDIVVHHLVTRGAGGHDVASNLVPLCVRHHDEIHRLGNYTFKKKYGI